MSSITKKIRTFEDACEALGIKMDVMPVGLPIGLKYHLKAITAHTKLVIIVEALNEGWKPNWDDWNELKYYPWFNMGSPSGVGFSYGGYGHDCATGSDVGSRLCFKSRELAEYAGNSLRVCTKIIL